MMNVNKKQKVKKLHVLNVEEMMLIRGGIERPKKPTRTSRIDKTNI